MENKPEAVVIGHSLKENTEDISEHNSTSFKGIRKAVWIVPAVFFVYSMIVVSSFIEQVYNRGYEYQYDILRWPNPGIDDPQIQLEFHQHNSEFIDGTEYEIYEIKIEDDDYLFGTFMISLTEPYAKDDEFEIQLGNTAISKTDSFSFTIAYSSSNSSGGARFSCSNFADCDEDKDGWLYDYNEGDDVYFCNCGTFYDNSMMVAIPVGNEPTRLFVYLDYNQDPFLTSLIYRTVLTFGLAAGVVFGRKTENKFFTWTILSLGIPLMLLGPSIFVHLDIRL